MSEENQKYLEFAKTLAVKAGDIIREYSNKINESNSSYKKDGTIVTEIDVKINDMVIESVNSEFPEHSAFGEEKSIDKESSHIWVCDPIDGTAMFARNVPVSVFSIALVVDGEPIIGVVSDPHMNNFYEAVKGFGAKKNGKNIEVNRLSLVDKRAVVCYDYFPQMKFDIRKAIYDISEKTYCVSLGSAVRHTMLVAEGNAIASILPGGEGKNVDIAAAKVIVEESGGRVTNFKGKEQRYDKGIHGAVCSNGFVHSEILNFLDAQYNF